jgi:hypothetical protein
MEARLPHPEKAEFPIKVRPAGRVMEARLPHPEKA